MKSINRATLFMVITFTLSFALAGIFKLSGGSSANSIGFVILGTAYMFTPMIAAIVVKKLVHHEKVADLLISFNINRWFFVAWGLMPLLAFGTFGISLLFPGVSYSPDMAGLFAKYESTLTHEQIELTKKSLEALPLDLIWISLLLGLLAGISINAIAGFGEELGWRGFLLKEFKEMSFFRASLIIGFVWGVWHAPLILMGHNYPQHPLLGVLMMILWCIMLTPLFIYMTIKSQSVIAAAIMHGTLNATAGLAILKIEGGNDLTVGVTGLAGFVALAILVLAIYLYDKHISKDKIMLNKLSNYI